MAEKVIQTLVGRVRDSRGKKAAKNLRKDGRVPAVVYHKNDEGVQSVALDFDEKDINQLVSHRPMLIKVDWEGGEALECVLREVQRHPITQAPTHLDFQGIQRGVMMDFVITVRLEGIPVGVKDQGGVLQHVMYEVNIKCMPRDLPNEIVVDVSDLEIGDAIHIEDLSLENGTIEEEPQRTVVTVVAPRMIEEEEEEEEEGEEGEELEEGEVAEGEEGEAPEEAEGEGEKE